MSFFLYKKVPSVLMFFQDVGGNIQLPDDSFDGDNIHRFDENAPGLEKNFMLYKPPYKLSEITYDVIHLQ